MYHAPQPIQDIARTFAELQVKRHFADYDLSVRYIRSDVLGLVEQTNTQIATFAEYPQSSDRRFFLACLWAWKELASR